MTDNIERFPGESRGPSLGDTISGQMGPGFPHGTCPWLKAPGTADRVRFHPGRVGRRPVANSHVGF
jgi:hypothetical protein